MVLAIARWHPIASMVTLQPLSASTCSKVGRAVISLGFTSTAT
jgi:hypothetical protein